jgi:hypothetical protein
VNIPVSIACEILSTALYNIFAGKKPDHTDIALELDNGGKRAHYTCDGVPLKSPEFIALLNAMQDRRKVHPNFRLLKSPYPTKPVPLCLEHTGQVVGWGRIVADDHSMRIEDSVITDTDTWRRIKERSLKGISIGLLVREAQCEICGESYFECGHIAKQQNGGVSCAVRLTKSDLCEISIVTSPINLLANLHWEGEGK